MFDIHVPSTAARDDSTGTHGAPGAPVSRNRKLQFAGVSGLTEVVAEAAGRSTGDSSAGQIRRRGAKSGLPVIVYEFLARAV